MPWTKESVAEVWGFPVDSTDNEEVLQCLKDMSGHEARDRDVFVTENAKVLSRREWIEDREGVWVLSTAETLDYADVFFKNRGQYVVAPNATLGAGLCYWSRLAELVPAFPRVWTTVLVVETSVPSGTDIKRHLQSFSERVTTMLRAKDMIGREFYKKANNLTQKAMLYHLSYFMMLATGTFDSFAWICKYLFNFQYKHPVEVVIRGKKQNRKLLNHLEKVEPNVGGFLISDRVQTLLEVFYPSRDSIQHRHMLEGIQYSREKRHSEKEYSLVVLDEETKRAIGVRDEDDPSDYFTKWGVRRISDDYSFW